MHTHTGTYFSESVSGWAAVWFVCRDSVLLKPIFSILAAVHRKRTLQRRPNLALTNDNTNTNTTVQGTLTSGLGPPPLWQDLLQLLTRVVVVVFVFSALIFSALGHDDGLCAMRVGCSRCMYI